MTKGEIYAEATKVCTLQDLIDLVCLKATLDGASVRIKVSFPKARKGGGK